METLYTTVTKEISINKVSDKITLWFFGDVHRDSSSCDVERWKWFRTRAKSEIDENTYFIGMGDYHDFASATEQKALLHGKLHEETKRRFDESVQQDNRKMAEEIKFMRGRILGLIEGNHSWQFADSSTATEDLATRLDTECLGWLSHISLRVFIKSKKINLCLYIIACHGKAGGKTFGNTINQVGDLKTIFPIADIYCMGHDHQRTAHPVSILVPYHHKNCEITIKQKRQFLCRSGSFKKGYQSGASSYEVGRLYRPSDLGALKMTIGFHQVFNDNHRIITDIEAII